ncbi:GNAT family N-acetyltransferase [Microbacterium sp.]|uniref:GNAT family N-acetyltransferase n=1 Tax=Microbacterium sp. TaxID=51671 RepID=UPI00281121CB|nr:GNAT family N-acetyltransferase [Microbacterium sp.]
MGVHVEVRAAVAGDADGIAAVHVRAWQEAYRGLMPQEVLDGLSIEQRAEGWRRIIAQPQPGGHTIVADRDGAVVGWATYGTARDADPPSTGELWGIYAHPDAWSTGVGHALLIAAEESLQAAGHTAAYLWVLDGNARAARFYERHGWIEDGGTRVEERPGLVLHERRHVKRFPGAQDPA